MDKHIFLMCAYVNTLFQVLSLLLRIVGLSYAIHKPGTLPLCITKFIHRRREKKSICLKMPTAKSEALLTATIFHKAEDMPMTILTLFLVTF